MTMTTTITQNKSFKFMFKNYCIGTYFYKNGMYLLDINTKDLHEFKKNNFTSYDVYNLDSLQKISKKAFHVLEDMLKDIKQRKDILEDANIDLNSDNDFEILYKYSFLNQYDFGFYVKQ